MITSSIKVLPLLSKREISLSLFSGVITFVLLGTVTAMWSNPFFLRMTSTSILDYLVLISESVLLGLYLGIKTPKTCKNGTAGVGGTLAFLGFACPVCNKLLLLLFGSTFLLSYFEPIRIPLGIVGICILSWALLRKLELRVSV